MSAILRWLTSARHGAVILALMITAGYVVMARVVYTRVGGDDFLRLSWLCAGAVVCILIGSRLRVADLALDNRHPRIVINEEFFLFAVWGSFAAFAILAWVTAERIPLLAAFAGADSATLAYLRERFLKAREGWQSSFVYIHAIFTGALVPYCLARMFWKGSRYRWLAFGFFFVYCISFLEKAYFLKAVFPLLYFTLQGRFRIRVRPEIVMAAVVGLMLGLTALTAGTTEVPASDATFFSAQVAPSGAVARTEWRAVAIPLITAADAIRVFNDEFGGRPLHGATSTPIAHLFGLEHVFFERQVFFAQVGQNETGTGAANSVYVTEAYVNFGLAGVIGFSLVIGMLLRLFANSKDEAFRAVWILFASALYAGGLIGVLLSNGFVLLFLLVSCVRLRPAQTARAIAPPALASA